MKHEYTAVISTVTLLQWTASHSLSLEQGMSGAILLLFCVYKRTIISIGARFCLSEECISVFAGSDFWSLQFRMFGNISKISF